MKKITIAVDGPSGAGKSTVAKLLAAEFDLIYIDSGAMYRSLTYELISRGIDLTNNELVLQIVRSINISWKMVAGEQKIFVNNNDVTTMIRTPLVDKNVSFVASMPAIRSHLSLLQKEYGINGGVIMDGRDIGTVIFPKAEFKFFLIASAEERARRRCEENFKKGIITDLDTLQKQMTERDRLDESREIAPLKKAIDGIEINTTKMKISEVVTTMSQHIKKKT